jgi:NADH-quinone oxidoreductase subunit C
MDYFCFLSGLDWMPSAPNPEEVTAEIEAEAGHAADEEAAGEAAQQRDDSADPAGSVATHATAADAGEAGDVAEAGPGWTTGVAGGDTRFQVFSRLYSTRSHRGVTLKADLDEKDPRVRSVHDLYRGADWHERETAEMYGFTFEGHPHPAHLYLPGAFEGHPLRKDFPLLSREVKPWPGLVDVEDMPEAEAPEGQGSVSEGSEEPA